MASKNKPESNLQGSFPHLWADWGPLQSPWPIIALGCLPHSLIFVYFPILIHPIMVTLSPIILSCHWDHSWISRSIPGLNGILPYRAYPEIWLLSLWPLLPFPPFIPFLQETEPSELLAMGAVDGHDHQEFSLDYLRMQKPRWWHR